jgi:hypothetical protein
VDFYDGRPDRRDEWPWPNFTHLFGLAVGAVGLLTLRRVLLTTLLAAPLPSSNDLHPFLLPPPTLNLTSVPLVYYFSLVILSLNSVCRAVATVTKVRRCLAVLVVTRSPSYYYYYHLLFIYLIRRGRGLVSVSTVSQMHLFTIDLHSVVYEEGVYFKPPFVVILGVKIDCRRNVRLVFILGTF